MDSRDLSHSASGPLPPCQPETSASAADAVSRVVEPYPLNERGFAVVPGLGVPSDRNRLLVLANDLKREVLLYGQNEQHREAGILAAYVRRLEATAQIME